MALTMPVATRVLTWRNFLTYRRAWFVFLTGFLEPVFYLFSIGVGVGALVGGFDVGGQQVAYAAFVAPGMLAASAFNGALLDSTFGMFFKLRYQKIYTQMLATPLTTTQVAVGETAWCLLRSGVYSAGFLAVMGAQGLLAGWTALLALPAAWLIGFATAAVGIALTSYMRTWQDFELVTLVQLPMFLFSATFFPLSAYPSWLRGVVEVTPLYRGVVLCRELPPGLVTSASVVSVVYLLALGLVGLAVARRRLATLLLT